MAFDLVIRNGTVIDGSGGPGYRADVGIVDDRIAEIGQISERGAREIDAEGYVVTPGFIDAHTHMDAQVFWDPLGTNSCWHGVTTVVMGNCGFSLAPSQPGEHKLVIDNLVRAEDIPAETIAAGINWSWETFPEYLDAVDATPKGINYAAQIGHSAIRTSVMGERAFGGTATDDDLAEMEQVLREALRAGAVGFTTSVSDSHETPDGRAVASRAASWDEIRRLVKVLGAENKGVFQLAIDTERTDSEDTATAMSFFDELLELAIETKVPSTYGVRRPHLAAQLDMFDRAAAAGAPLFGLSRTTYATALFSFQSRMPFDGLPAWRELRARPFDEQAAALRDPAVRAHLIANTDVADKGNVGQFAKTRSLDEYEVLRGEAPYLSVGKIAAERGVSAIEVMIDLALETNLGQVYRQTTSADDERDLLTTIQHPHTIMTFSDSGAHIRMLAGGDLHTILLGHWVRERQAFTLEEAVRMITAAPARAWGIPDRGELREGMIADINVFDPETIGPEVPVVVFDFPAGAQRVAQKATGMLSTVVGGREVIHDREHTGELPGRLIRDSMAHASRR